MLYVAATRARRELHLLACIGRDDHGCAKAPARGSLLATLWPAVEASFRAAMAPAAPQADAPRAGAIAASELLVRLARPVTIPALAPVAWAPAITAAHDAQEIEFSWVGETARRVGSVTHRWLQRIAEDALRGWTVGRIGQLAGAIRAQLVQVGVPRSDLEAAVRDVQRALVNALEDSRGRWLLGPHPRARSEWRLTAVVDGVPRALVIDRYFEDANGDAWIVDFKTSAHEGGDLDRFLAEEERRYRAQLERYAAALPRRGARLGLYFPLLRGWREWRTETEAVEP